MEIKRHIKKLVPLLLFLILSALFCSVYFKDIYSPDAYYMKEYGLEFYNDLTIGNMRPILAVFINIAIKLGLDNFAYFTLYKIFLFLSAILLTVSMYLVYRKICNIIQKNKKVNKITKFIIFISITLMFLNRYIADNLVYLENIIMVAAIFLAVIAAVVYTSDKKGKSVIALLLLILSEFMYQTMVPVFVVLSLLFYILENKERKVSIKYILKTTIMFVIPLIVMYITSIVLKKCGIEVRDRMDMYTKMNIFTMLINYLYIILLMLKDYLVYIFIAALAIYVANRNMTKTQVLNIAVICAITIVFNTSFAFTNNMNLSYRMIYAIGMIPGILGILAVFYINDIKRVFVVGYMGIIIYEWILYYSTYNMYYEYNKRNIQISEIIILYIDEWNETNDEKIESISFYNDEKVTKSQWYSIVPYIDGTIYNSMDNTISYINDYGNKIYVGLETDNQVYENSFKGKNWDDFSDEQFVVKNNTLHVCRY